MKPCIETDSPVEIALAANDWVFDGLLVAACSIARFANPRARLSFNILDGGIAAVHFMMLDERIRSLHPNCNIRRIAVSESDFGDFPEFHGCRMAYARLLLPDLLCDKMHVIYCDTDFLWISDIAELWSLRDDAHALISVRDPIPLTAESERRWFGEHGLTYPEGRYFCSGLCLFNLRLFREKKLCARVYDFLRVHTDVHFPDQAALNVIVADSVQLADVRWQVIPRNVDDAVFTPPLTLHYAGENPWKITFVSKMLTDAQLLWFYFDAGLRGCSVWRSLRRYYSAPRIVVARIVFLAVMSTPLFRALFDMVLKFTHRDMFRETISFGRFKRLKKLLRGK